MKKYLTLLILLSTISNLSAQLKHDANWVIGYYEADDPNSGATLLKFIDDDILLENILLPFQLRATISTYSNTAGDLISTTNGIRIADKNLIDITGSTVLNDGDLANDTWSETGYFYLQGILTLPSFDSLTYDFFHLKVEIGLDSIGGIQTPFLLSSKYDLAGNSVYKNELVFEDGYRLSGLNATKHANGRDWWIMAAEYYWSEFHTILHTPEGFTSSQSQEIGEKPHYSVQQDGGGQNLFSPDGSIYVDFDSWNGMRIFDFDRCTGQLSNFRLIEFEEQLTFGAGASISPNSRFLYYNSGAEVFQLDLWADSLVQSIEIVGTYDTVNNIGFTGGQLGPNGKIYFANTGSHPYLHVINQPNEKGLACDLVVNGIELPAQGGLTLPYYPNYNLGALANSPCDTITAIKEVNQGLSGIFKLSPNPLWNHQPLSLDYTVAKSMQSQLQLLNITGQVIWQKETQLENGNHQIPIATPQAKGVYFLHIRNEIGESVVRKVVVQ